MSEHREDIHVTNIRPLLLLLGMLVSTVTIVTGVLVGNLWMIDARIESNNVKVFERIDVSILNRLAEHTEAPHPITLQRAQEIAAEVARVDNQAQRTLAEEVRNIQVKQAGFLSDITWIKNHLIKQEEKFDKVLDRVR